MCYLNVLPIPKGTVDVICGGPPCQGISGFNRFRSREDPLKDEKKQTAGCFYGYRGVFEAQIRSHGKCCGYIEIC